MKTPLRRFASSPLGGGTTPVAGPSPFHGVCWVAISFAGGMA